MKGDFNQTLILSPFVYHKGVIGAYIEVQWGLIEPVGKLRTSDTNARPDFFMFCFFHYGRI